MLQESINSKPLPKPGVYKSLDAWRGVAALWVVAYHMTLVILKRFPQQHGYPVYEFSLYGWLGVQMFFVISGYCIVNAAVKSFERGKPTRLFVWARLRRIYPTYWFGAALAVLVAVAMSWLVAHGRIAASATAQDNVLHNGLLCLVSDFTLTHVLLRQPSILSQSWTLCYEVAFYGVIALALLAAPWLKTTQRLLAALHLLTIGALILLIAFPNRCPYPLDLWPQFGLGVIVFDVVYHPRRHAPKIWLVVACALTAAFAISHNVFLGPMTEPSRLSFAFTAVFALVLVAMSSHDERISQWLPVRWLSVVGLFSYSLYLTHTFSIGLINQAANRLHLPEALHLAMFIGCILCALIFARIFYAVCEKPFAGGAAKEKRFETGHSSLPNQDGPSVLSDLVGAVQAGGEH